MAETSRPGGLGPAGPHPEGPHPEEPSREDLPVDSVPVRPGTCPTSALLARAVRSSDLFGGAKMVLIEHAGEQYRLIVTKNDKLILQK